ncbi:MAG: hypothetical protein ACTJHU_11400, partial [Mycetocola sp.]
MVTAPQPEQYPAAPDTARPERRWNGVTLAILGGGVLLVAAAATWLGVAVSSASARGTGEAAVVAETFVSSAVAGDNEWQRVASNQLLNDSLERSPLTLDATTLAALDAEVTAHPGQIRFIRSTEPGVFVDEA